MIELIIHLIIILFWTYFSSLPLPLAILSGYLIGLLCLHIFNFIFSSHYSERVIRFYLYIAILIVKFFQLLLVSFRFSFFSTHCLQKQSHIIKITSFSLTTTEKFFLYLAIVLTHNIQFLKGDEKTLLFHCISKNPNKLRDRIELQLIKPILGFCRW